MTFFPTHIEKILVDGRTYVPLFNWLFYQRVLEQVQSKCKNLGKPSSSLTLPGGIYIMKFKFLLFFN